MATKTALAALLVFALLGASTVPSAGQATAASTVKVEYLDPDNFTDVGNRYRTSDKTRAAYLQELSKHVMRRAAPRIPEGQTLTVSITEIDMAGSFEPWRRHAGDVRIIRDVYPPRIDLHFRLTASDGAVLKNGERKLRDLTFLMTTLSYRDDPLRFEKALIDNWLEREFPPVS